jgi:acyl-CoA thioester hydrolase
MVTEFVMTDENCLHLRAVLWTTSKYIDVTTGKKTNHQPEVTNFLKAICVEGINFENITFNSRIKTIKQELLAGTFI